MTASTATRTADFAIRTKDAAWISRNGGQVQDSGRVTFRVPLAAIEPVMFAGRQWLRVRLTDCPRDFGNAAAMSPAYWVPETAALFAGQFKQDGR